LNGQNANCHKPVGYSVKLSFSNQQTNALTRTDVVVVVAVVVVLAFLAISLLPEGGGNKRRPRQVSCIYNLKETGIAFRLWGGDNDDKYPMAVSVTNGGAMELIATGNVAACFRVMSNELNTPRILLCPDDTHRTYATNFSTGFRGANISYFVNPDAVEAHPQMILDGDDNLTVGGVRVRPGILNLQTNAAVGWTKERHRGAGNIGMADGSVQQSTTDGLRQVLQQTGVTTNRLAIP
jgi:prepilin-type processing-associated H-X9-DG protein